MRPAFSALMSVIVMGAIMLLIGLSLLLLGGDSNQLVDTVSKRYSARNLAKACAEKAVAYIRHKEKMDANLTYQARILLEPKYDTMVYSTNPLYNYGASQSLGLSANSKLLFKFDLASNIPAGATILSGTLKLYSTTAQTNSGTIYAHRILPANAGWLEGTKSGTAAVSTEPNWSYKDYGSMIAWSSAGLNTSGTDYYAIPDAYQDLPLASSTVYNFNLSSSTLNTWMTDANNAGVLLRTSSAYWTWFATKEATSSYQRPVLDLVYSASQLATVAGGLSEDYGYCFYDAGITSGTNWRVRATGISDDVWSRVLVTLVKSTTTSGFIAISSWNEVSSF